MSSDLMYSKIIDFLEKDGAICNYFDKSYDENETYNNPIGNRGLFKKFNDTITLYHKILKCLIGEIRCDITESIPVIDFNIPSYTSLTSTYDLNEDGSIDPSSIYTISGNGQDLLELQLNQISELNPEKSLLNRAICGEEAAKLFYNTTSNSKSDNFIFADYMKSDKFYYKYLGSTYDLSNAQVKTENISIFISEITDERAIYGIVQNHKSPAELYGLGDNFYYISKEGSVLSCNPDNTSSYKDLFRINIEKDLNDSNKLALTLNADDDNCKFYGIKIPMTYNHINYYKFMFIQRLKSKNQSSESPYTYKALTIFMESDPDTNIVWEELKINNFFPDFMNHDIIMNYVNSFVKSEKIYYSDYSGIMNGQYSYPLTYTNDSNETVSKWAYVHSDSDKVPDGYKYYSGHILNRGDFLNSCTALTPNDYPMTGGTSYKGKLSLYYNNISKGLDKIFGNLSGYTYDEWVKNFNSYNFVGSVVKLFDIIDTSNMSKLDIISKFGIKYISQTDTLKHPNKGKIPLENIDNIKTYLKNTFKSYWGSSPNQDFYLDFNTGEMTVRLGAFDKVIHTSNTIYNVDLAFWQKRTEVVTDSRYTSNSRMYTNVDENIHSKKGLHCKLSFNREYHNGFWDFAVKHCKTYHYNRFQGIFNVQVQLSSPLEDFSKTNEYSKDSSILIYPQSDDYFSSEIYLISPYKVLIPGTNQEISSSNEPKPNNIITFCSKSKLLSFYCIEKLSYTPSKIKSIKIIDDLGKTRRWTSEYDHSSETIRDLTSNNISVESIDCYLYVLKSLDINMNDESKFYDTQNNVISLKEAIKDIDLSIMPMSYPKSFFEVEKENDSLYNKGLRYRIIKDGYSQINSLKGMRIIVGYPPIENNTYNEINKTYFSSFYPFFPFFNRLFKYSQIKVFGDFIKNRLLILKNELISNISKEIFLNWPITDKEDNPIKIKNLPEYFNGLKDVRDILYSLKSKNLVFNIDGKDIQINDNDITYINKIIDGDLGENLDIEVQNNDLSGDLENILKKSIINIYKKTTDISNSKSTFAQLCDRILDITDKNKNATFDDYDYIDSCIGNNTGKILNSSSSTENLYQIPNIFSNEVFKLDQVDYESKSLITHRVDWKFYITDKIANICYDYIKKSNNIDDSDYTLHKQIFNYFVDLNANNEYIPGDSTTERPKDVFHNIEFPDITIDDGNINIEDKKGDGSLIFGKVVLNPSTNKDEFIPDENLFYSKIRVNIPKYISNQIQQSNIFVDINFGMYNDNGYFEKIFANKDYIPFDKLEYISRYIQRELDCNGEPIRYIEGNEDVLGNTESLYYKRYKALNSRINTMSGDLYFAALTFKNIDMISKKEGIDISIVDSYSNDMLVLPISSMSKSKWLPEQEATLTTVKLEGKLYDEDIAESLRSTINNRCVLTCRSCSVKAACPFYNEDEVIKMYVPDLEYIKFSLKDNKLNLISDVDFDLKSKNKEIKFSDLDNMHHQWASIINYNIDGEKVSYNFRKIEDEENKLKSKISKYTEENPRGLGWLTKARYGTITSNKRLKELENEEYDPSQLYDYRYLYDAMFIYDEETYFKYKDSTYKYDVSLNLKENGLDNQIEDNEYSGSVRLKIPYSLDFSNNGKYEYSEDDLLFLVSDDTVDDKGNSIIPLIYINTLRKAMEYSVFDLNEIQNVDDEILSEDDDGLYPKDVAQWSVNILKGDCVDNPLSEIDDYTNYDQYWMPQIKKKVLDSYGKYKYITINGRPRENTNHLGEAFTSIEHVNELAIVSGKPVVGTYQDFTRSFMLSTSIIKWVYPEMKNQFGKDLTYEQVVNKQKSTLPCMKTNLRFVLLKNNEHITI